MVLLVFLGGVSAHADNTTSGLTPSYTDENGTYPKNYWQPSNQKNVRNHQGGTSTGVDNNNNWDGDPSNTKDSYLKFGTDSSDPEYAIRKYAKETNTPGLYDVYLNVKGNSQKNIKPVDIVLVVDMSGSMDPNNNPLHADRAQAVRDGVKQFLQLIEDAGIGDYVNVGLVGYSSPGRGYRKELVGLGSVSNGQHRKEINDALNGEFNGGTFTQLGIRQGTEMLTNDSSDNKKMMILLTDGVPTSSYKVVNSTKDSDGTIYGTKFNSRIDNPGNTSRLKGFLGLPEEYTDSSGNLIKDTWAATLGEAKISQERVTELHALGIQLSNDANYLDEQQVRERMEKIASPGMYQDADSAAAVTDYLNQQAKDVVSGFNTIVNGSISDPLGAQFNYASEISPTVKSVGAQQVTKLPDVQLSSNQLNVANLNLGKDQEIQVHYQVHMNTEDKGFQPEHWYQMNGTTTLTPRADQSNTKVEFGVPSAKAPGVTLNINKIWHNLPGVKEPNSVNFTVSRQNVGDPNSWQNASGSLTANDGWKKEFKQLKVDSQQVYLPKFNNNGQDFKYELTKEDAVDGYIPSFSNDSDKLTITNTALGFQVQKYAADSSQKLTGATYKLIKYTDQWQMPDTNTKEQEFKANEDLSAIKPGYYSIEEVSAPQGYQLNSTQVKFRITDDGKFLDQSGQQISQNSLPSTNGFYLDSSKEAAVLTYAQYDKLKDFELVVTKVDQDNQNKKLANASFNLTGNGVNQELATDSNGLVKFVGLKPGSYSLKETKAPKGYSLLQQEIKFTINKDGAVKLPEDVSGSSNLTMGTANNTIRVTIKDHAQGVLPKTGGHGISGYLLVGLTIIVVSLGGIVVFLRTKSQEV